MSVDHTESHGIREWFKGRMNKTTQTSHVYDKPSINSIFSDDFYDNPSNSDANSLATRDNDSKSGIYDYIYKLKDRLYTPVALWKKTKPKTTRIFILIIVCLVLTLVVLGVMVALAEASKLFVLFKKKRIVFRKD